MSQSVTLMEVAPRDGLQAESVQIPAEVKIEFVSRLLRSGVTNLEVTSFVHPHWVPQLGDAPEVFAATQAAWGNHPGVHLGVLVPNQRGLSNALTAGVEHAAVIVSCTETFAQKNLNTSRVDAVDAACDLLRHAQAQSQICSTRAYVSMVWGDPWEGKVSEEVVCETALALKRAGADRIVLSDTIGIGTPDKTENLLTRLYNYGLQPDEIALHMHNTYGQALANILTAWRLGVTEFDSSAGGLGRCPFARGATGNIATEELVWMFDGMGVDTGIDLDHLINTSLWMHKYVPDTPLPALISAYKAGIAD